MDQLVFRWFSYSTCSGKKTFWGDEQHTLLWTRLPSCHQTNSVNSMTWAQIQTDCQCSIMIIYKSHHKSHRKKMWRQLTTEKTKMTAMIEPVTIPITWSPPLSRPREVDDELSLDGNELFHWSSTYQHIFTYYNHHSRSIIIMCVKVAMLVVWRSGNIIHHTNKVTRHQARLVLGWVTIFRRVNHLAM